MQCSGGAGTFSSKSPSPGSLAQGFSPAPVLAPGLPSRRLQQKQRLGEPLESLPVQPPRHACELLWAGGIYEVGGEPPTQRRLVPPSPGTRSLGARLRTQQGRRPGPAQRSPQVPRSAPPALTVHRAAISPPRLPDGGSPRLATSAPPKQAQELGMHKPLGRSLYCHRAALSTRLARRAAEHPLNPAPRPPHPWTGRAAPPHPLTSSPVHHLLGAPLGHGFHGARLCSQLGESRRFKSYYPGPLSSPRGRAPRLVPVRRSAPSRLHGRGQRVIPERLSQDSAAPSRAHGTVARLLLQLPPSSCSSSSSPSPPGARAQLQLLGDGSCGDAGP